MSGMLVPVGVGIAGALFILGALYSIKIMNRRRRNGSKRHKRKVWQMQGKTATHSPIVHFFC